MSARNIQDAELLRQLTALDKKIVEMQCGSVGGSTTGLRKEIARLLGVVPKTASGSDRVHC